MSPTHRPLRHRGFLAGAVLVSVFAAASLLAPVLAPEDPHAVASGGGATLERPTAGHPLGTDALGRDVLSRVLWGGRVSLAVGVVLVALGWTTIARVVRGEVLSLKARDFVQAARALGGGHRAIMLRHLLPNALAPLLVAATIGVGGNMVAEAGLSFLGLGAQSPTISWGAMLADGQTFLAIAPWVAVFPGAALLLAVLGINLLGDGLRDLLDPRLRA